MTEAMQIRELDLQFKDEVSREPGCQYLLRCFACGVCTATCPVADIEPGFSPSLIIRQVMYGMRAQVLAAPALWYCARCANCSFQCPQDVRFLDIIQGLRQIAIREGAVSAELAARLAAGENLIQELRRRLIGELLANPEKQELKETLTRLAKDL